MGREGEGAEVASVEVFVVLSQDKVLQRLMEQSGPGQGSTVLREAVPRSAPRRRPTRVWWRRSPT